MLQPKKDTVKRVAVVREPHEAKVSEIQWNRFAPWVIFHAFLLSAVFIQNQFFRKILSVIPSECQTVWIQIRPDILSGLIWVQTVLQRLSADNARRHRVKELIFFFLKIGIFHFMIRTYPS